MRGRRKRMLEELDQDIREHIERETQDNIERGMTPEEAAYAARRKFGNVMQVKEDARNVWSIVWLEQMVEDMFFGLRMLRKNPSFAAVAILTLALGIGANAAIFSVMNAVLLRPLAMEEPSRVMYVQEQWRDLFPGVSVGNFNDLAQQSASFANLCASNSASFNLATSAAPERVQGELASGNYFATFGVQPLAGRGFTTDEDKPGRGQVVVISERLWRTQLRADLAIVGQPLLLNGARYTVVGIMPKSFDPLLNNSDIWIPEAFTAKQLADYDNHYLNVMGRLKNGVSAAQAQAEMDTIAARLQHQHPIDNKDRGFRATSLTAVLLGDQKLVLRMMLGAVGLLLLIACANVANLQLARARSRQREIALRAAVGASPQRIVRQLLAENVVLGVFGGVGGILLAFWGVSWVVAHGPADVPRLQQTAIDARTLAFACGVTLFSSVLFGLAPALRSASIRLSEAFKAGTGSGSGSRDRLRSGLVIGEVGLALMLMAGAGLLIRSALLVSRVDPGFDTPNLVVGRVGLSETDYHDPAMARQTFERMVRAAAALPGVQSAAAVSRAPLAGGGNSNGLLAEGKPFDMANLVDSQLQVVSPGYVSTVRIPLKAGRDFTLQDTRDRTLVTLVNETLARSMWPGQDPIGKRFACCEPGPKGRMDPVWHEVVGVVADVRAWGLDRQVAPEFYLPLAQMPANAWDWIGRTMDLVVRTEGGAIPVHELQSTVASVAPGIPIYHVSSMQNNISSSLERSHFDTMLLAIFAVTALLLSTIGIYGVLSYTVAQRTRDIGIRMTLGATRTQVMGNVLSYGARLTGLGLLAGLGAALVGTRVLTSLLYSVRSTDAVTFAAVSGVLAAVALIASYIPARRATRVDPMVALRHE
jgi:putative ABC transport system permease protein